jgi:hypothetical protein
VDLEQRHARGRAIRRAFDRDVLTGFGERLFDQRVEIGGDDGAQGARACQRRQRAVVGIRLVAVEHLQHWQVVVAGEVADEKLGESHHA